MSWQNTATEKRINVKWQQKEIFERKLARCRHKRHLDPVLMNTIGFKLRNLLFKHKIIDSTKQYEE